MWNKDEIEGKGKQAKGAIKDKLGEWSGNPELEEEGEIERAEGDLQETVGTVKRKTREFANDVKRKAVGD